MFQDMYHIIYNFYFSGITESVLLEYEPFFITVSLISTFFVFFFILYMILRLFNALMRMVGGRFYY